MICSSLIGDGVGEGVGELLVLGEGVADAANIGRESELKTRSEIKEKSETIVYFFCIVNYEDYTLS